MASSIALMQGKILFCKKRFEKAAGIRITNKTQAIRF